MTSLHNLVRAASLTVALVAPIPLLCGQCGIDPNYGTNLMLSDDSVSPPQMLGFTFPFAGANYDAVCVSSNGFVYLFDTGGVLPPPTDPRCCTGNFAAMLASTSPIVSALWTDLNPSAAGSVHFNAGSGRAWISYVGVPEFIGVPGVVNTCQIVLRTSGVMELHFDTDCDVSSATLAGWSPGNGAANPGQSNLSAVPFTTTSASVYEVFVGNFDLTGRTVRATPNGVASWMLDDPPGCARTSRYGAGCRVPAPILFGPQSGSRPVLNTTFNMRIQNVPATTASGVLVLGVSNPNLNLAFLGLPINCVLLASLDVMLPFPTTAGTTILPVPIPNNAALTGRSLNAQTILLIPTLSGLPIALSNGLLLTFGL